MAINGGLNQLDLKALGCSVDIGDKVWFILEGVDKVRVKKQCPLCNGSGELFRVKIGELLKGEKFSSFQCPTCRGSGDIYALHREDQILEGTVEGISIDIKENYTQVVVIEVFSYSGEMFPELHKIFTSKEEAELELERGKRK